MQCEKCQGWIYINAKPAAGAVVIAGDRFLAVRRAKDPAAGLWGLPGGFCEGSEHPADAAVREVFEETGLRITVGPLVGLYTDSYAYQGDDAPTLNTYYLAGLSDPGARLHWPGPTATGGLIGDLAGLVVVPADDAADAGWFALDDPPPFAFTHLKAVLADAVALLDNPVM